MPHAPPLPARTVAPRYPLRLTILQGDVFDVKDLERTEAASAVGFFLISNGFGASAVAEDKKVLRRALAVRNYANFHNNFSAIFIQVPLRVELEANPTVSPSSSSGTRCRRHLPPCVLRSALASLFTPCSLAEEGGVREAVTSDG